MLDTDLRANELCSMDIRDYDLKTGELLFCGNPPKARPIRIGQRLQSI